MDPKINDGGPAFPVAEDHQTADSLPWTAGMSLRDYFAAGVAGHIDAEWQRGYGSGDYGEEPPTAEEVASRAYEIADAMLKQREARP